MTAAERSNVLQAKIMPVSNFCFKGIPFILEATDSLVPNHNIWISALSATASKITSDFPVCPHY